ncbi:MAG: hypothetical protein LBU38_03135 [Propionibacteriaceae bacterium]|jgi:ABC-2 type transport system permease protein|nr:hypothetical protein [Propionibacteriaceae bacterium]
MSVTIVPIPTAATSVHLSFFRVLRSEQIKFFTLRSTWWTLGAMTLACIGVGTLMPLFLASGKSLDASQTGELKGVIIANLIAMATTQLGLLFMVALAVLVITNEYSSGMIRSTLVAVPRRLPVLATKTVLISLVSFLVTMVIVVISAFLTLAVLNSDGLDANFNDPAAWRMLLSAPLFVTGLALIGLGIGFMVRSTAAGITAAFALIYVVPIVLQLFTALGGSELLLALLPSEAGAQLSAINPAGLGGYWGSLAILFGWAAASLIGGGFLLKKRDA